MSDLFELLHDQALVSAPPADVTAVPECDPNDARVLQIALTPSGSPEGERGMFITPEDWRELQKISDVPPTDRPRTLIENKNVGRLFATYPLLREGFRAEREIREQNGGVAKVSQRFAVCRAENSVRVGPDSAGYELFISPMQAINNISMVERLRRIPIVGVTFSIPEIIALSKCPLLSNTNLYSVSSKDPMTIEMDEQLLIPDGSKPSDVRGSLALWLAESPAFSQERKNVIIEALNEAGALLRDTKRQVSRSDEATDAQLNSIKVGEKATEWQLILGAIGTALGVAGIAASVWTVVHSLAVTKKLQLEAIERTEKAMDKQADRMEKFQEKIMKGPNVDPSKLYEDVTDSFRSKDLINIPDSQKRYIESIGGRFNQGDFHHAVLSGPSGSGKSFTANLIGKLAVNGQLNVEEFKDKSVRFVRISAGTLIADAKNELNGVRSRFNAALDHITEKDGPVIIHLLESDRFASAGMGEEIGKPLNLLPDLYTIMEGVQAKHRNVYFILDSTRWQTIREAAPDLLRRAQFTEIIPALPEDVRKALEGGIEERRTRHEKVFVRQRFERVRFSSEALDAIVALGDYKDGAPPSSYLQLVDSIAERADAESGRKGTVTVTESHIIKWVANELHTSQDVVARELRARLGTQGISQNPRIQAKILESFYRAYPEPMEGKMNPLSLPSQGEGDSFNLFGEESRSGRLREISEKPQSIPNSNVVDIRSKKAVQPPPLPSQPKAVSGAPELAHGGDINPEVVREQILAYFPELNHTDYKGQSLSDGSRTRNMVDALVKFTIDSFKDASTRSSAFETFGDLRGLSAEELWKREKGEALRGGVAESFVRASVAVRLNDMRERSLFAGSESMIAAMYRNSEDHIRDHREELRKRANEIIARGATL